MRREWLARITVVLILAGLPLAVLGYQYGLLPLISSERVVNISATIPETGGFSPGSVQVRTGETVTLRFTSMDVTHGIAIGPGLGIDLGQVDPGKTQEITLTFERGGIYTFYCTVWCSPNHWRMRGILEVTDADGTIPPFPPDPVIDRLVAEGINIDTTPTPAVFQSSASPLSLVVGATVAAELDLPADLRDASWRRTHSPQQALMLLTALYPAEPESNLVDAVAYLWRSSDEPAGRAAQLYEQNCAACHGPSGRGDGFAAVLTTVQPAAFTDLAYMFTRRSDVLYAKIRRGGMGTDMPNFGTLFTPEETWALVDYVWSLALK
ncbi:MAG: c-type cytochrome [Anaerolineae bacterium]|nr:c-type cytochrome [Anaerolineae bacterium]